MVVVNLASCCLGMFAGYLLGRGFDRNFASLKPKTQTVSKVQHKLSFMTGIVKPALLIAFRKAFQAGWLASDSL